MRFMIILMLSAVVGIGYYFYEREGSAEKAGAVIDDVIDKTTRIIDVVTE